MLNAQVSMPRIMLSLGKFSLSHLCVKISAAVRPSLISPRQSKADAIYKVERKRQAKGPSVLKPLSLQVDTCSYLPDDSIRGPQHIVLAKTIHPVMYSISIGEVPVYYM